MKKNGAVTGSLTILFLLLPGILAAAVLEVGKSGYTYTGIQAAIDAAAAGDTVLVHDGNYKEHINFRGKAITVRSENGASKTTINGQNKEKSVVSFISGEGPDSILDGFSVVNGKGTRRSIYRWGYYWTIGGGIYCNSSSPILKNLIIKNNWASLKGGGIYSYKSTNLQITNCFFDNNDSFAGAGAITSAASSLSIRDSIIKNSSTGGYPYGYVYGGGINSSGKLTAINCFFINNRADSGGAIYARGELKVLNCTVIHNTGYLPEPYQAAGGIQAYGDVEITNSIIWSNDPPCWWSKTPGSKPCRVNMLLPDTATVSYSNIGGGWDGEGNINADPLCEAENDYHLSRSSPCIDTGTSDTVTYPLLPSTDLEGDARPYGASHDMGADEVPCYPVASSDCDGDGIPNSWEEEYDLDPYSSSADEDADGDGFMDYTEYTGGTHPLHGPLTYYVDAANTGVTEDGSLAFPYNTIEEALAVSDGGDTVSVEAGEYSPSTDLNIPAAVKLVARRRWCKLTLADNLRIRLNKYSVLRGFAVLTTSHKQNLLTAADSASAAVTNNLLENSGGATEGVAAVRLENSSVRVENNIIRGWRTALSTKAAHDSEVLNNIMENNIYGWRDSDNSSLTVDYNNFWNNTANPKGDHNISKKPLFVENGLDPSLLVHLQAASPCRDAGHPNNKYNDRDGSRNDLGMDGGPKGALDNTVPSVSAAAEPASGSVPLTVQFTGSAADEWGIASWSWDFDNLDGIQADSTEQNPLRVFETCGRYVVTLTVTDHSGLRNCAVIENLWAGNGAEAPLVTARASPSAVTAGTEITFSATTDDSSLYTWSWDFADGSVAETGGPAATIADTSHAYTTSGSYRALLTVTDDSGCQIPVTAPITVVKANRTIRTSALASVGGETSLAVTESALSGAAVLVPSGALARNTVITISEAAAIASLPAGASGVGSPLDLGPDGCDFTSPVTLSIPYSASDLSRAGLSDPYSLKVYYYDNDESAWREESDKTVDSDNSLIKVQVSHFTLFTLTAGVPLAPSELTAAADSSSRITLTWEDNSEDEKGFKIERKSSGGEFGETAVLEADLKSYQDDGLGRDREYCYRVRAYNSSGDSEYSDSACAKTGDGATDNYKDRLPKVVKCFIATAAYNSPLAESVQLLVKFRDMYLLNNTPGRYFVRLYYRHSPPLAELISKNDKLRSLTRAVLRPVVWICSFLVHYPETAKAFLSLALVLPFLGICLNTLKRL